MKKFLTSMLLGGFVLASTLPAMANNDPLTVLANETCTTTVKDVINQPEQLPAVSNAGCAVKQLKAEKTKQMNDAQKQLLQTSKAAITTLRNAIKTNHQTIVSLKTQARTLNKEIKQLIQAKRIEMKNTSKQTTKDANGKKIKQAAKTSVLPENVKTLTVQLKSDRAALKASYTDSKSIRTALKQAHEGKDFTAVISGLKTIIQLQTDRVNLLGKIIIDLNAIKVALQ